MMPERASTTPSKPARGRRWLAIGGVAVAAIVAGGLIAVVLGGRDDARPVAAEPSPTATASLTPSPTPTLTAPPATPQSSPGPTANPPPPSEDASEWIGPELISTRAYGALSLVVDPDGIAHAASELDGAIYYLTSATGSWTREPVSNRGPGGPDFAPTIALDDDGSLWVAFSRGYDSDFGVLPGSIAYVTNRSGQWSDPVTVAEGGAHSPSLAVRQGRIHLAYVAGHGGDVACANEIPVHYATDVTGTLSHSPVAAHGDTSILALGSDGTPHILLEDHCGFLGAEALWYATTDPATGSFGVEGVPGPLPRESRAVAMELDAADRPHVIFWQGPSYDEIADSYYTARGDDGWAQPEVVLPDASARSMVIDDQGAAHIVGIGEGGVWYASNRGGAFQPHRLGPAPSALWASHAAIAVDPVGQLHILFEIVEQDEDGELQSFELWYAIGPHN